MEPLRDPPVPFWRCSFLVLPLTSLFSSVLAVPWRLLAKCCFTSSQMAWSFGVSIAKTASFSLAFLPVDLPSVPWMSSSILLPDDHVAAFRSRDRSAHHHEVLLHVDLHHL